MSNKKAEQSDSDSLCTGQAENLTIASTQTWMF